MKQFYFELLYVRIMYLFSQLCSRIHNCSTHGSAEGFQVLPFTGDRRFFKIIVIIIIISSVHVDDGDSVATTLTGARRLFKH